MFKSFRSALLAACLFGVAAAPAFAVGPIQSQIAVYPQYNTYSATIAALTPAASATDFFVLTGSATKTIWVRSVSCTGTSTAAAAQIVTAFTRTVADTSGTSTAPVALALDSTFPAATATVAAYTANPTIASTGTFGAVATGLLLTIAPASAGVNGLTFAWPQNDPNQVAGQSNPLVLRGTNQQLALSAGGVSFASGASLTCNVVWTEH